MKATLIFIVDRNGNRRPASSRQIRKIRRQAHKC